MWHLSSCKYIRIPWGLFSNQFSLLLILLLPFSSLILAISCDVGLGMETNGSKRRVIPKWM
jgi:hypothetical protein